LTISREGQVVGIADDTLHNPLLERFNLDRVTIQARNESGFALLWTSGQDTADGNSHTSRVHFRLFDSSAVPASTEVVLHEGLNTLLGEIQESYLGRNRKAELVKVAEGWHVLWAGIRFSPISPFELDRTTLHARSVNVQGHVTALGSTSDRGRQDCSYFWGNIVRQNVLLLGCGYIQNVSLNGKNLSRRYSTSLIPPARIANRLFFVREVFPFPGSLPNRDLQLSVIAVQE